MKNEQLFEQLKNEFILKKVYNIAKIDFNKIIEPENERMKRWQKTWDTQFTVNIAKDLVIFNQKLQSLPNGKFQIYQSNAIKAGNLREAWEETFATIMSHIIYNAAQGRESLQCLLEKKPNIAINAYKKNNKLVIEVKDDGEGILKHILEGLEQGAKKVSTKGEGRGGGLGLICSKEAIFQLGGEMEIESLRKEDVRNGQSTGTTIRFVFSSDALQK